MNLWFTCAEMELQGFTCAEMNCIKRFMLTCNCTVVVLLSYSVMFGGNCCTCKCAEIFWKCKFCLLAWMEKCWVIASSPPSGNNSALFAFPNCQISGAEIFVLSYLGSVCGAEGFSALTCAIWIALDRACEACKIKYDVNLSLKTFYREPCAHDSTFASPAGMTGEDSE